MPGPLPKPDDQRRRRNTEGKSARLQRRKGAPPPLPPRGEGREWSPEIVEWWGLAWGSHMASRWQLSEVHVLVRYCQLWQMWLDALDDDRATRVAVRYIDLDDTQVLAAVRIKVEPDGTLLGQMSAIEDRFGLSSIARRRLYWELEDDDPPDPAQTRRAAAASRARRANDPRLKVVSDGKERGGARP